VLPVRYELYICYVEEIRDTDRDTEVPGSIPGATRFSEK
jgi:hypothetical protein